MCSHIYQSRLTYLIIKCFAFCDSIYSLSQGLKAVMMMDPGTLDPGRFLAPSFT